MDSTENDIEIRITIIRENYDENFSYKITNKINNLIMNESYYLIIAD